MRRPKTSALHFPPQRRGPGRFPSPWNARTIGALRRLTKDGRLTVTIPVAAARLNLSTQAVERGMRKFGIKGRLPRTKHAWTRKRIAMLQELHAANGTIKAAKVLAKRIGYSECTIHRKIAQHKRETRYAGRAWTKKRSDLFASLLDGEGHLAVTKSEAARRLGCHRNVVDRALRLLRANTYPF